MAVWCRQSYDGVKSGEDYLIAPVDPADSDLDLLNRKAASHGGRDWVVLWTGPTSFIATKVRLGNGEKACERVFEIR